MAGLASAFILITIFAACHSFSLDRLLLDAKESNETDGISGKSLDQKWLDYSIPSMNGSFINLQIDMLMTLEEAEEVYEERRFRNKRRRKRSAVKDRSKLWPRRIPYHIDDKFDDSKKLVILKGLQQWSQYTCLEFVPRQKRDFNYINFVNEEHLPGCYSFVGMQNMPQSISLFKNCLYEEIIIHEVGHAIGLHHEHSRPDRDSYVTIKWENIRDKKHDKDFDKISWAASDNYSKPYDYSSIMHYSSQLFTKDTNLHTIVPNDTKFLDKMGKANTLSFYDAMIVSSMYNCSAGCKKKICPKQGFLGKNCECYCPGKEGEEPVKLCEDRVYCDAPDIDATIYTFRDKDYKQISNLDRDFFPGTKITVEFKDMMNCGIDLVEQVCVDGNWTGGLPECESESCIIPESWKPLEEHGQETVLHGTNLSVVCSSAANTSLIICQNGTFVNSETGEDFDVGAVTCGIGKPRYRIIKDEGRVCEVEINTGVRFTVWQEGERRQNGDHVQHLSTVIAQCDDEDETGELSDDDIWREMTCKDGRWDSSPPEKCPKVRKACDLVTNALVTGPFEAKTKDIQRFKVTCADGFIMEPQRETFACDFEGVWSPHQPICSPKSCKVSEDFKDTLHVDGNEWFEEIVPHNVTVSITCDVGHVVDADEVTCKLGKWNIKDNVLPTCRKVTCPMAKGKPFFGLNVKEEFMTREYLYGFKFKLPSSKRICKGDLERFGPEVSECQRNGEWSSTIGCRTYCKDGKSDFKKEELVGKRVSNRVKPSRQKRMNNFKTEKCLKRCLKNKDFLCMTVSYGYDPIEGYVCKLYRERVAEKDMEDDIDWVVAERECKLNSK